MYIVYITYYLTQANIFQGILVTDFERSYAVFTYYCGDLEYSSPDIAIGFSVEDFAVLYEPNGSPESIDCINLPNSSWVNIVYGISESGKSSKCVGTLHCS